MAPAETVVSAPFVLDIASGALKGGTAVTVSIEATGNATTFRGLLLFAVDAESDNSMHEPHRSGSWTASSGLAVLDSQCGCMGDAGSTLGHDSADDKATPFDVTYTPASWGGASDLEFHAVVVETQSRWFILDPISVPVTETDGEAPDIHDGDGHEHAHRRAHEPDEHGTDGHDDGHHDECSTAVHSDGLFGLSQAGGVIVVVAIAVAGLLLVCVAVAAIYVVLRKSESPTELTQKAASSVSAEDVPGSRSSGSADCVSTSSSA